MKKLRELKLRSGLPFMINVKELSTDQCYLEYPDGSIKLVSIGQSSSAVNVIRELSSIDSEKLRHRFHLQPIAI